jgi:hypothetical protein
MRYVSPFLELTGSHIFFKLRRYRTNLTNTPARPSRSNWADEILGMDTPDRPTGSSQSLKEEVQSYFLEALYTLGSVRYWQVR